MELPESALPHCVVGDHPTDRPKLEEVICWREKRKDGGPNKMIAPRPTGRVACFDHALAIKRGEDPDQGNLL